MTKYKLVLSMFIALLVSSEITSATGLSRVTECSNPSGMSYDVHASRSEWKPVNSSKLSVIIMTSHEDINDIIIKDGIGEETIKHSSKGYYVIRQGENRKAIIVDTSPLGILEVFQLEYNDDNTAFLFWTTMKNKTPPHGTTQTITYVFTCKY